MRTVTSLPPTKLRTCTRCGDNKPESDFYKSQPISSYCKACQREYMLARRDRRIAADAVGVKLEEIQANANQRGLNFDLDREDVEKLLRADSCACCGVRLDDENNPLTLREIDRINNAKGYVKGNCFATCYRCNRKKKDLTLADVELLLRYLQTHLNPDRP